MADSNKKAKKAKKTKESKKAKRGTISISGPTGGGFVGGGSAGNFEAATPPPSSAVEEKVNAAIASWAGLDAAAGGTGGGGAGAPGAAAPAVPQAPAERKWKQKQKSLVAGGAAGEDSGLVISSPEGGSFSSLPSSSSSSSTSSSSSSSPTVVSAHPSSSSLTGAPAGSSSSPSSGIEVTRGSGSGLDISRASSLRPPPAGGDLPAVAPPLSKDQRTNVINEIILTERDYVRDLDVIVNTYLLGIRNQEKLMDKKDIDLIFSNVEQLLAINTELLKDLEKHFVTPEMESAGATSAQGIGDAFIRVGQYLKSYTVYCTKQQQATSHLLALQAKSDWLNEILLHYKNTPEARKLDLPSYLIKPVQRICKYPLLLRELIKSTPDDHPDLPKLKIAEALIQTVASAINEGKRIAEENDMLFELQNKIEGSAEIGLMAPARKFIRKGPIKQITVDRKVREDFFFLFNDLFLVVEPAKKEDHYTLVAHFPFSGSLINSEPGQMPSPNAFEIVHMGFTKMILYMDSEQEKEALFNEIANLIMKSARAEVIDLSHGPTNKASPDWRRSIQGKSLPKPPASRERAGSLNTPTPSPPSSTAFSSSLSASPASSPASSPAPPPPIPRSGSAGSGLTATGPKQTPPPPPSGSKPPTPAKPTPPPPPPAAKTTPTPSPTRAPNSPTPSRPLSTGPSSLSSTSSSTTSSGVVSTRPASTVSLSPTSSSPTPSSTSTPISSTTSTSSTSTAGDVICSRATCGAKFKSPTQRFCTLCGSQGKSAAPSSASSAASDLCSSCKTAFKLPTQRFCTHCGTPRK